jgi:ParB family chromosome partitioning protein
MGADGHNSPDRSGNRPIRPFSDETGIVVADLRYLPIDAIRPNEFQPRRRFDETQLAALTDSVRELGVLQPILVRRLPTPPDPSTGDGPVEYGLVAGERRWRAARRAGLTRIPALVRDLSDLRSLEEAIVENLHRSDLNALEEAAAYQQLIDEFGLSQSQIAHRVGKSRSAVANTLRLTQLPVSVQRMVVEGKLTAGHARAILAVPSFDQRMFAERIVDQELSVRSAEQAAQNWAQARRTGGRGATAGSGADSGSNGRSGERLDADGRTRSSGALEVESRLERQLDTRVRVTESARGGRIVIDYADAEDLGRIFQLLTEGPDRDQPA